jgi:hypothetical protein
MLTVEKMTALAPVLREDAVNEAIEKAKTAEEVLGILKSKGVVLAREDMEEIANNILEQKGEALEDEGRYLTCGGVPHVGMEILDVWFTLSNFAALNLMSLFPSGHL